MQTLAVSAVLEAIGGFLVLAVGYGGCFLLWHFIFSPRNRHDDDLDRCGASSTRPPDGSPGAPR
jgi:hypothetical protein